MKTKRTLCNKSNLLCNHKVVSHTTEPVPSALDEVLPRETSPCRDAAVDWAELETVLEKLEPLLATDNTAVNDLFDEFEELLKSALGKTGELLGRQIRDFDYADALLTLHTAREKGMTNTTCPLEE